MHIKHSSLDQVAIARADIGNYRLFKRFDSTVATFPALQMAADHNECIGSMRPHIMLSPRHPITILFKKWVVFNEQSLPALEHDTIDLS